MPLGLGVKGMKLVRLVENYLISSWTRRSLPWLYAPRWLSCPGLEKTRGLFPGEDKTDWGTTEPDESQGTILNKVTTTYGTGRLLSCFLHWAPRHPNPGRRVEEYVRGIWLVQEEAFLKSDDVVVSNKWHSWITLQRSSQLANATYSPPLLNMSRYPGVTTHLRKASSMKDRDQKKHEGRGATWRK